jgi:hypothetical protein
MFQREEAEEAWQRVKEGAGKPCEDHIACWEVAPRLHLHLEEEKWLEKLALH